MMTLNWIKCGDDHHWCSLEDLILSSAKSDGVYIIWHEGNPARVVRVGQGDVSERLCCHRAEPEITGYSRYGKLRVTWAAVPAHLRDGVERYLADQWKPLVGDCYPAVAPIAVNSPFAA